MAVKNAPDDFSGHTPGEPIDVAAHSLVAPYGPLGVPTTWPLLDAGSM